MFHRSIAEATGNPHFLALIEFLFNFLTKATLITRSYEATRAALSLQVKDEHQRIVDAISRQDADARITSYNVCYTKLLRVNLDLLQCPLDCRHLLACAALCRQCGDFTLQRHSQFDDLQHRLDRIHDAWIDTKGGVHVALAHENTAALARFDQSRITSYNVCYTKLLRIAQCDGNRCSVRIPVQAQVTPALLWLIDVF